MSNTAVTFMPTIQSDWKRQLDSLRTANENALRAADAIQLQFKSSQATQSQLDQAKLAQRQAAQKYNSFVESGSQLMKIGTDA